MKRSDLAIIDIATFRKAGGILKTNKNNSPRRTKREYLFRSRITCECGRRFIGKTIRKLGKDTYKEYRCGYETKQKSARCSARKVLSCDYIDEAVWKELIKTLNPSVVKAAARDYVACQAEKI